MSGTSEIVRICLQRGGSLEGCYNDGVNPPQGIIITPSFGPDGQVLPHAATGQNGIDIGLVYQDAEGNKLIGLDPAFISLGSCAASGSSDQTLADILTQLEALSGEDGTGSTTSTTDLEETLESILTELQGDINFQESIWCDDTNNVFIRIREFDNQGNAYLAPRFELPDGAAYTPTGTPKPCASTSDREFRENSWIATADGTGYSEGDSITQVDIIDTETNAVTGTLWYNATTGQYITPAPPQTDLGPAVELPELTETKQCVYNCDGEVIVELREIVVSVGGLIQGHDATAYTTADYPGFVGDGSSNVRSYYQNLDGTNVADADRPVSVSCDPRCPEQCVTFGALFDPATGNLKSGYEVCSQGALERVEFDAVSSTLPQSYQQLENTLTDSNGNLGTHWTAGQTPNIVLTYTFNTPQDNITEFIFGNNNGSAWFDHETDEISFVVKDSAGAIIYTQPITQVPVAPGSSSQGFVYETGYPVGTLNDVGSVELTLESERNLGANGAGAALRYFLPVQVVGVEVTCELFCEDGSPAPDGQSLLPIKGDRFSRVTPGVPQILTAGATWSPPPGTTEVQWKSTGTGNTMTTAGGTGPLGEGSGSIANGPNESIDWSSVVFTAGPAPDELCITYKVAV